MGSRSEGPDKNRDAEGMLTREGVATNKKQKQLDKAQNAVDKQNNKKGRKSSRVAQTTPQGFLDKYNSLKDQKKKSRNELSQLGRMNEQMGYNPTTGMGIGQSANFNTIGAGADIANLMNNPLVKLAGMAVNPLGFAGSMLGKNLYQNLTDEDDDTGFFNAAGRTLQDVTPFDTDGVTNYLSGVGQNLSTDFRNTTNALSDFQQAPNISTGLSGLYNNFINSLNTDEEETAPNFNLQSLDQLRKPTAPNASLQINKPYSNYGGDFNAINFGIGSPTTTDSTDQINTGGFADTDMFRSGVNLSPTEYNPVATSGTNIGLNNVFGNEIISDTGGALTYGDTMYGQEGYDSIINSGGIPVGVTQDMGSFMDRREGRNQGGLIPPMSGPMSNGLGNLFKMK